LLECEEGLVGTEYFPKLLNQLLSVLGNEHANLFIFGGVLPCGEGCRLNC